MANSSVTPNNAMQQHQPPTEPKYFLSFFSIKQTIEVFVRDIFIFLLFGMRCQWTAIWPLRASFKIKLIVIASTHVMYSLASADPPISIGWSMDQKLELWHRFFNFQLNLLHEQQHEEKSLITIFDSKTKTTISL